MWPLALALVVTAGALCASSQVRPEPLAVAQRFIEAAYPDGLARQDLSEQISGHVSSTGVTLPQFAVLIDPSIADFRLTQEGLEHVWFIANFEFSQDGQFVKFRTHGMHVNYAQNRAMFKEGLHHLDWTDVELLAELKRGGARYGPDHKAEVLELVPTAALRDLAGQADLVLSEAVFDVADSVRQPILEWTLTFRSGSHPSVRYVASLEPFGGKVISFARYE